MKRRFIQTSSPGLKPVESLDFSLGYNSYLANDVIPSNQLRTANDARISTIGRYSTRKGCEFYSVPAGETIDQQQTSATGAAAKSITKTTWYAAKYTAGANGRLTKVELELKNTNSGIGPVIVQVYDNSSGAPGVLLGQSSVAASVPTGSNAYCAVRFMEAPVQTSGTVYWVVANVQFDGSHSYEWNSTTNATTSLVSTNSGVTWSAATYAMHIKTYVSTAGGALGHFRARKSDGTVKTLIAYKEAGGTTAVATVDDVTGALSAIKTGLSSSATYFDFEQVQDVIYYVNGVDAPRKWDFTTEAVMAGSPPIASRLKWHKDQMFFINVSDPARVDWSDKTAPESFTSTNFQYIPAPKSNDPIVNWAVLNDNLYFLTPTTKWALYGSDLSNFILRKVPGSKGTIAADSMVIDGNNIYFAAYDNFYAFNGSSDQPLMTAALEDYRAATNRDDMSAQIWNGRLYIFYSPPGSASNNECWVVNLALNNALESKDTGTYIQRTRIWGTDSNQFVQASNLVGALYYGERDNNLYNNLGKNLSFELETKYEYYGTTAAKKQVKRWYPRFGSANHTVNALYDKDFEDSPTSIEVDLAGDDGFWGDGSLWQTPGQDTWGIDALVDPRLTVPGAAKYTRLGYMCMGVNVPVEFDGHSAYYLIRRAK